MSLILVMMMLWDVGEMGRRKLDARGEYAGEHGLMGEVVCARGSKKTWLGVVSGPIGVRKWYSSAIESLSSSSFWSRRRRGAAGCQHTAFEAVREAAILRQERQAPARHAKQVPKHM